MRYVLKHWTLEVEGGELGFETVPEPLGDILMSWTLAAQANSPL